MDRILVGAKPFRGLVKRLYVGSGVVVWQTRWNGGVGVQRVDRESGTQIDWGTGVGCCRRWRGCTVRWGTWLICCIRGCLVPVRQLVTGVGSVVGLRGCTWTGSVSVLWLTVS